MTRWVRIGAKSKTESEDGDMNPSENTLRESAVQLLNYIGNDLKLLWSQMDVWDVLFVAEHGKRLQLRQQTAPGFFAVVQVTLAESILMRLGRLMDPAKQNSFRNASFPGLLAALPGDTEFSALRQKLEGLQCDWAQAPYSNLQVARNKWLAHNDLEVRSDVEEGRLGMPMSSEDFAIGEALAKRLWSLYVESFRALNGVAVLDPTYDRLESRPVMLLKHLCASLYLDQVLDEDAYLHEGQIRTVEAKFIGEDLPSKVFRQ